MRLHGAVLLKREGKIEDVVRGKNGHLFLGTQAGFDFDLFTSGRPFNQPLIELWKRTLRRRARELRQRGIPFAFVLVPDAHSVCREDLPDGTDRDFQAPGDIFLAAMSELEDVIFVDVRGALLGARGGLPIYRHTDSHWTQYGAYVAYRAFCDAIAARADVTRIAARDVEFRFRHFFGDLGVLVEPEQSEKTPRATIANHPYERLYENEGLGRLGLLETRCASARPCRALFFRDSFMTDQFDFIGGSFSNVLTAGTTTSVFLDAVDEWKPDIVVNQVGERRLFAYETDHRAATFDDVFRSDFTSPLGRKAQQAMLLVRAGDPAGALSAIDGFAGEPELAPDHAYVGAQVCFAARCIDDARGYLDRALAARPDRPSYLALDAQIRLERGQNDEALQSVARAIEVASYNGYYHELYAYILIAMQRVTEACAHLDATLDVIDDSSNLWYWASIAREASGNRAGAADAIRQAIAIGGAESPAYLAQSEKFSQEVFD